MAAPTSLHRASDIPKALRRATPVCCMSLDIKNYYTKRSASMPHVDSM